MKNTFILFILTFVFISCNANSSKPIIVVTGNPIAVIIKEIAGPRSEIVTLVPPGASPHTYTPKPTDMRKVAVATAFIYTADNNDGWAANIASKNVIKLIDLLPEEYRIYFGGCEHDHNNDNETKDTNIKHEASQIDPHFWLDPLAVKAVLPALVEQLSKFDPENAETYRNNADLFAKRLDLINRQIENIISNVKGKTLFTFHPSFNYFIKRYSLVYGGAIEEFPGKEAGPRFISNMSDEIRKSGVRAIFTEPQLAKKPAEIIAESAGVDLFEIDPVGGYKGRVTYADLLLYNARIIKKALD